MKGAQTCLKRTRLVTPSRMVYIKFSQYHGSIRLEPFRNGRILDHMALLSYQAIDADLQVGRSWSLHVQTRQNRDVYDAANVPQHQGAERSEVYKPDSVTVNLPVLVLAGVGEDLSQGKDQHQGTKT